VLETALMATRRDDLKHGTVAAYAAASARTVGRSGWPGTANASSLKCKFSVPCGARLLRPFIPPPRCDRSIGNSGANMRTRAPSDCLPRNRFEPGGQFPWQ
jgi:hypothetical protein